MAKTIIPHTHMEEVFRKTGDTRARSLVKTIIWRIIATLVTLTVVYMYTGLVLESLEIALVAAVVSMIAYYIHERIWNIIRWGRK